MKNLSCKKCDVKLTEQNSSASGRKTRICRECKAKQDKEWREANKEKCREVSRNYYEKNKEELARKAKIYRSDPEVKKRIAITDKKYREGPAAKQIKARKAKWYQKNIDHCRKKGRENRLKKRDHYILKSKEYRDNPNNKGQIAATKSKCRVVQMYGDVLLPSSDFKKIEKFYEEAVKLNAEVGKKMYAVDHIIPLSIGGAHHQDNLRVITISENSKKRNKYIPELGGVWADSELAKETKEKLNIPQV